MENLRHYHILQSLLISCLTSYVLLRIGAYMQPSLISPVLLLIPLSLALLCALLLLSLSTKTS